MDVPVEAIRLSLAECARLVGGTLSRNAAGVVSGVAALADAGRDEIAFISSKAQLEEAGRSAAGAMLVPVGLDVPDKATIAVNNPILAATILQRHFLVTDFVATGVHARATVGRQVRFDGPVAVGPCAVIGDGVRLGARVTIHAGVVIGENVEIGDGSVLHPNVTIYSGCVLGRNVIVHAGAVIGSDGFGYVTDEKGCHLKRPHVGTVVLEDEVEIGANCCIDRGTFGVTRIGAGTKIDNMVQIAHNVTVGRGCLLAAQVGISGSSCLGEYVAMGGQAGVADHLKIGDRVMVAGKSGVIGSVGPAKVVAGFPAQPRMQWLRANAEMHRLAETRRAIAELQRQVDSLAEQLTRRQK